MEFRAKLNMEMKTADQPGVVTLSFVPVTAGVPQISMTVPPAWWWARSTSSPPWRTPSNPSEGR